MTTEDAFADMFAWIGREMNRADRYVDVPPEPDGGDIAWTQRDMFSTHWHRWRRVTPRDFPGPSHWSDQPGFSHTWGSLHCHYRRVVVSDGMPASEKTA